MNNQKKKRIKKVFDNKQCCHVWAAQAQEEGCNSQRNIFFEGTKIYSYGYHYLMAQIYPNNGNVVLINEHMYSPTTGKHRSHVFNAVSHRNIYCVSDPSNPLLSIQRLGDKLITSLFETFRANRHYSSNINNYFDNYNKLCDSFGYTKERLEIPNDLYIVLNEYLEFRKQRNKVLDATKIAAQIEKQKQRKIKNDMLIAEAKVNLIHWLKGQKVDTKDFWRFDTESIRVKGNKVETTGGANVPLVDALLLLNNIELGKVKSGDRIGSFEYDSFDGKDIVTIGCHTISLNHAKKVLKEHVQPSLSIVSI